VGLIGCGTISGVYLENCSTFPGLRVVACADLEPERAEARAREFGVPRACTVDRLLEDPDVELVLNLTIPAAHAEVSGRALAAGKHVYSEKPLALNREDGRRVLQMAADRDLLVGCAPDTFLGPGLQACRAIVDRNLIGEPVAATASFMAHGPEHWHPNPAFLYQEGAGPLFDLGPYYLTALISFMGPVRRVTSLSRITFPERLITSQPLYGTTITVGTPTFVAGLLEFASGAIATLITSFDVWSHSLPPIEIYGSEGTMQTPDPNTFGGPGRFRLGRTGEWQEVTADSPYTGNCRGLGLKDMAEGMRSGTPFRASGALAYHVLDVMQSLMESAETGRHIDVESSCTQPAALPMGITLPTPQP
jgi:predicted dehydrogenase